MGFRLWLRHALSLWLLLLLSYRTLSLRGLSFLLTAVHALRLLHHLPLRLLDYLPLRRGLLFSFLTAIHARLLHYLPLRRGLLFSFLTAIYALRLLHNLALRRGLSLLLTATSTLLPLDLSWWRTSLPFDRS